MTEYINKSKAYDYATLYDWLISSTGPELPVWTDAHIDELMKDFLIFPNDTPTADVVEVRHGKWKHLSGDEWICNQCGFVLSTERSWEHPLTDCEKYFCEHCGADMREETK